MPKTHELKTETRYFDAVARGDKTFEVRNNDRDFQTGDTLILREWDPKKVEPITRPPTSLPQAPSMPGAYTGRTISVIVSYVLHDTWENFGIGRGFVVLGFRDVTAGKSVSDILRGQM